MGGSQLSVESSRWTGNGLSQIKETGIFGLAEIQRIMQFLKYNKLRTMGGTGCYALGKVQHIGATVGGIGLLYEAYFYGSHYYYA